MGKLLTTFQRKLGAPGGRLLQSDIARVVLRLLGAILLGLLLMAHRTWPLEPLQTFGVVLLSIAAGLLLEFHVRTVALDSVEPRKADWLIWTTALLAVLGVQIANLSMRSPTLTQAGFLLLAPVVAQAMLVSALLGPSLAMIAMTAYVLLMGVSGALPVELLAPAWIAGVVGAHGVNPMKQRRDLFRAISVQSLAHVLIALATAAVAGFAIAQIVSGAGWAVVAAVIATSIFWLGVVVFERLFGITSDWTLLELCSPDHKLLRELNMRAPGTYAHSVMVGNLAESAARSIGANPVLARAMAYYHDVGKLVRPSYFVENQLGEMNVHEEMSPSLSAEVIMSHVKDGIQMAQEHKLPRQIVDGIAEHHGTTLIAYFYNRALKMSEEPIEESVYRYPGPKPQSRESAILHLADIAEASARTLRQEDSLEERIGQLIDASRQDGQLDDSQLTFRDLKRIGDSFIRSLAALKHDRIEYPGQTVGGDGDSHDHERIIEAFR